MNEEIFEYIDSIAKEKLFKKIAILYDISNEIATIRYILNNYDSFRKFYAQAKYFEEHPEEFSITNYIENGYINLSNIPHIESRRFVDGSSRGEWHIFPNLKTFLFKGEIDGLFSKFEKRRFKNYNILVAAKVAEAMGIKSAKYYLAKDNEKTKKIITCNFLEEGQSLISGEDISSTEDTLKIEDRLKNIEVYLRNEKVEPQVIKQIRQDYIKLSFFNKFIKNCDEDEWNFGFIQDSEGKIIGLAPAYDFDFSFDVNININRSLLLNDNTRKISSFIKQFSGESWFSDFVQRFINNFNIDEVLEGVQEEHKIELESRVIEYYKNFLQIQFEEVKTATKEYFDFEGPLM